MGLLTKDGDIGYYPVGDKHVCSDCFGDECIKGFIESQADSLKCDFCGRESSEPIAALLNWKMGALRTYYWCEGGRDGYLGQLALDGAEAGHGHLYTTRGLGKDVLMSL
jgi:hypothetical protein